MSDLEPLDSSDPRFAGTWHPFPPPDKGFYDLRQAVKGPDGDPRQYFFYFPDKRVYESGGRRLLCMNRRVTKMQASQGWQFRFKQEFQKGVPVRYRPFAVIYDMQLAEGPATAGVVPVVVRKDDISQQLPIAASREEALYIVRSMPDRWPIFRKIHIEYVPEQMAS